MAKNVGDDTVTSGVAELSGDDRVEELARMLAGMDDSATGRAHAAELLQRAAEDVAKMRG